MDFREDMSRWLMIDNSYQPSLGELLQMGVTLDLKDVPDREGLFRKYLAFCVSPFGFGDLELWYKMVRRNLQQSDIIDLFHYATREQINVACMEIFTEDFIEELAHTLVDVWDEDTTHKERRLILMEYQDFQESFPMIGSHLEDIMQLDAEELKPAWKEWQSAIPIIQINRFMGAFTPMPDIPSQLGIALGVGTANSKANMFSMRSGLPMFLTRSGTGLRELLAEWSEQSYFDRHYPQMPLWIFQNTRQFIHSNTWKPDYDYKDRAVVYLLTDPLDMSLPDTPDTITVPPFETSRSFYMGKTYGFLFSGVLAHLGEFEKFLVSEL